jgi:colanic acid/amylovoran biosynthesis glycosyltransferase
MCALDVQAAGGVGGKANKMPALRCATYNDVFDGGFDAYRQVVKQSPVESSRTHKEMHTMKVTFCAYDRDNYVGGPNAWLRRLLLVLRCYGIQPQVLFITQSAEECPTVLSLRRQGINCREIYRPQYTEQRVHWIVDRLADDPPDVFVPNLMVPAYYAGRWVREAGIPTIGVLHSDEPFYRGLLSEFVFGAGAYQLSALVCVSKFLEQEVLSQRPDRVLVRRIPYGVPLPQRLAREPNGNLRVAYVRPAGRAAKAPV